VQRPIELEHSLSSYTFFNPQLFFFSFRPPPTGCIIPTLFLNGVDTIFVSVYNHNWLFFFFFSPTLYLFVYYHYYYHSFVCISLLLLSSTVCFSSAASSSRNHPKNFLCSRSTQVINRTFFSSSSSGPFGLQCVGQDGLTVAAAATTKRECVCVRVNRIFSSFSLEHHHHHCQPLSLSLSLSCACMTSI
jgi:hypothetical protein